nr:biotin/lipoate--protein ligase family protein [Bradyrhizobium erythrophlei]
MRTRAFISEPIELPPPFTLVRLRESRDAFTHALEVAAERGAGTLVYVGRFDLAEFAVVLEPDEPLRTARRAFYAGMVALTDALRAYAPPNKEVAIDWPDTIRIDGGLVGGGRLGWPALANEDEPPPWLVFGAMIRTVSWSTRSRLFIRSPPRWSRRGRRGRRRAGDGKLCAASDVGHRRLAG